MFGKRLRGLVVKRHHRRILIVGGSNFLQEHNHRIQHLVAYLERLGWPLDVIGQINFYTGPPTNRLNHFSQGMFSILKERLEIFQRGNYRQFTVRKLPGIVGNIVQEIWTYQVIRNILGQYYDLCIFGHPYNALLMSWLRRKVLLEP